LLPCAGTRFASSSHCPRELAADTAATTGGEFMIGVS
jgi:hypothetical protein